MAAHYHGVLREVLVHHFALLLYLLGTPTRLWAITQTLHYEHLTQDDQASVVAQLPDGSISHLFATFAADDPTSTPWTFLIKVLGTRGGISYSWRDAFFQRPLGTLGYAIAPYEESYRYEIEHFLTQCIGRGVPPLSTLADAATIHHLIEQAETSVASGNAVTVQAAEGAA